MIVAIYSRGLDAEQFETINILISELESVQIKFYLLHSLAESFKEKNIATFESHSDLVSYKVDCLISVGGDGTILDAVTLVRDSNIPILGINSGRLGFLASISKDEIVGAIDALVNHTYVVEKRSLIHCDSTINLFGETPFALNEFALHKTDASPMIKIHTFINGELLNT